MPVLLEFYQPKSIVDIGCGLGAWLKVAADLGTSEILGVDGNFFDPAKLLIDPNNFRTVDLAKPLALERRFDLAISLECAEHLPYSRSESFVADLVALSDVILFSAAAPYQGGTHHINEQWLEFWAILFSRFDYMACDVLRSRVGGVPGIEFWYKQNLMIFCKADRAPALFPSQLAAGRRPLSFVHPESLLINAARYRPLLPQARERERLDYAALLESYLAGETAPPPLKMLDAEAADQTRLFPEARTRIEDAREQLHQLRTALYERNNEIYRLNNEIWRLNNELYRLNCEAAERHREIAGLSQDLQNRVAEISRLHAAIAQREGRIQQMATALAAQYEGILLLRRTVTRKVRERFEACHATISPAARSRRDIDLVRMSGLFDRDYYFSHNPRSETTGLDPVRHYVERGAAEGRDPHPLFDTSFYLEHNPDVRRSRMNPLAHYHAYGGAEGRDPHPSFHTAAYLAECPQAKQTGMTPLLHYLVFHSLE